MPDRVKQIAENRRARHEYFIEETHEAGIELSGTEVKSLRLGRVSLREGYGEVRDGEVFLVGVHISPYEQGNRFNVDPVRRRRLLLHKSEIRKLQSAVRERGYTLVPLGMYFKNGRVKVAIALARGKKLYDKREAIAKRDAERDLERAVHARE
ncbi:MAG: SsrA-binding protein SmpB [Chloroflexota bacterium]